MGGISLLKTYISYNVQENLEEYLKDLGFIYKNEEYTLSLAKGTRKWLTIQHEEYLKRMTLSFPENVTMDDCHKIHVMIRQFVKDLDAVVDDTQAHLGYDEAENKVYIYHRFQSWAAYISKAKHRSLEGQRVAVFHGNEELGHGILLTYEEVKSDDPSLLNKGTISCTLLTSSGEQSFFGEDLHLEPMV